MDINVMMASGEEDTWENAADAIDDRGSLVVLYEIEGDKVPGDVKTLVVTKEIDTVFEMGSIDVPTKQTKSQTFQVAAQYAPGMWIKVEFA